jgi:selenide,water dikinase
MEEQIKLSSFSKGGGCGCKIAPSVLQQILQTSSTMNFPNLLVGNESGDDAAVYLLNEETALISTTDFLFPLLMTLSSLERLQQQMLFQMYTPWVESP